MKTQKVFIIFVLSMFLILTNLSFAQAISDQLKIADCDFEIEYDGKKINVIKQIITKRASFFTKYDHDSESGYGYGAGYESYHLEFLYHHHLDITREDAKTIEFYDAKGVLLTSFRFDTSLRKKSHFPKYSKLKKYYAIDLCHVPLLILDDTNKIAIK